MATWGHAQKKRMFLATEQPLTARAGMFRFSAANQVIASPKVGAGALPMSPLCLGSSRQFLFLLSCPLVKFTYMAPGRQLMSLSWSPHLRMDHQSGCSLSLNKSCCISAFPLCCYKSNVRKARQVVDQHLRVESITVGKHSR